MPFPMFQKDTEQRKLTVKVESPRDADVASILTLRTGQTYAGYDEDVRGQRYRQYGSEYVCSRPDSDFKYNNALVKYLFRPQDSQAIPACLQNSSMIWP